MFAWYRREHSFHICLFTIWNTALSCLVCSFRDICIMILHTISVVSILEAQDLKRHQRIRCNKACVSVYDACAWNKVNQTLKCSASRACHTLHILGLHLYFFSTKVQLTIRLMGSLKWKFGGKHTKKNQLPTIKYSKMELRNFLKINRVSDYCRQFVGKIGQNNRLAPHATFWEILDPPLNISYFCIQCPQSGL